MQNDHDIRVWLPADLYAKLVRRCHDDDRPISAYVRRLIARDIEEIDVPTPIDRDAAGLQRDGAGRHA